MLRFIQFVFIGLIASISLSVNASIKAFEFETVEQEKRFQHLVYILRCPTCQNQNLADSNSIVAEDLKTIVYEKVMAGESDQAIIEFMKQRYGEFIIYQPEVKPSNWFLWAGPFMFMALIISGFFIWYRSHRSANLNLDTQAETRGELAND